MQLGKQGEIECPAQAVEVGLKRQDRQYALEYSLLSFSVVKVSPTGLLFPQENLLAHARERIPWCVLQDVQISLSLSLSQVAWQ